ncbi:MAG: VOC family protein [Pseudomonadales bacterium]|nr:VOC family protein [Pseudomonadales bacterium]
MRLYQVAMHVADLDVAEAFYRDVLGADFVARFDPPGLLFFDFDGVRLLLESGGEAAGNAILYLWTDDIETRVAELEAKGVRFVHPPGPVHKDEDGTFGPAGETEWMAFFEDPEGNTVALVTRVD